MNHTPKVGDRVILGKHIIDPKTGETHNWQTPMDQYVGKMATVRRVWTNGGIKKEMGDSVYVDLDNEVWAWEVFYLQPISAAEDGCRCSKCREFVPYVEPSTTFVCYSCRHR